MTKKQRIIKENPEICRRCLKELAVKGKSECIDCNTINKENNKKYRAHLKSQGLCRDCGKLPVTSGESRCIQCLHRSRLLAHGLSEELYDSQMTFQDYKCAMCRKPFIKGGKHVDAPCIDHDHNAECKEHDSQVACVRCFRSILHHGCNRGLGILGDNPEEIIKTMENLKKFARKS